MSQTNRFLQAGKRQAQRVREKRALDFQNAREAYVRRLTQRLLDAHPEIKSAWIAPVFRNRKRVCHVRDASGYHQLILGRTGMHAVWHGGFCEYQTVEPYVYAYGYERYRLKGLEAWHWVTLHEFAHVLQTKDGPRARGRAHGPDFLEPYLRLLREFPYEGEETTLLTGAEKALLGTWF